MLRRGSGSRSGSPGPGGTTILLAVVLLLHLGGLAAAGEASDPEGPALAPDLEKPQGPMPVEDGDETEATSPEAEAGYQLDGYVKQWLSFRQSGSEDDLDSYTNLVADLVVPGEIRIRGHVNGRLIADLGGRQDADDLFHGYWDTRGGDVHARVYEVYVAAEGLAGGLLDATIGRQFLEEGIWFHFDGLRADLDLGRTYDGLEATCVLGIPVTFDEGNRSGNWLGGLIVKARLSPETRLRLEYYHVAEEFDGINDPIDYPSYQPDKVSGGHVDDDLIGLSGWHRIGKTMRAYGRFTLLNGDPNEFHLRGHWNSENGIWATTLEYFQLFERLRGVTNDLSPFVPLLGNYEPYSRISGRVNFRPDDEWLIQAGYSHRMLSDDDDEGTFNHEYDHFYAGVTAMGVIAPRLDASLLLSGYDSPSDDVLAHGGSLDYQVSDDVRVSGGIDYAFYKYDWYEDTEREDVWTYSLDAHWKYSKTVKFRARLSIDDDEDNTYTTFNVSVTVRF
jgi:hypothetical protein